MVNRPQLVHKCSY